MAAERKRIVFLCSGGGGNLRFVQRAIERGWIPDATIANVLTDRHCAANTFASGAGIPNRVVDFGEPSQAQVLAALAEARPDLVVTTVHRILNQQVVSRFRGRLLNLHYSLLPAFGGTIGVRPVQQALQYGARVVGATAHDVDENLDGGRPVVQAVVPVLPHDTADSLMDVVFRCGCVALGSAINVKLERAAAAPEAALSVAGRLCLFSAPPCMPIAAADEEPLWADIAGNSGAERAGT